MSSNLKSPPEGLKNAKCEKGTPPVRLPIPYVPPTDLLEKQEMEQIMVTSRWDQVSDAYLWLWK